MKDNQRHKKKINRIVIFTIDSLYSSIILDTLVQNFDIQISAIFLSHSHKGPKKSITKQIKKFKNSGIHFINYLTFVFIYYKFAIFIFNIINKIISKDKKISSIKSITRKHNIELIKTHDINNLDIETKIKKINPDIIISSYFDQLIKSNIYTIPKHGTINIHPGKLPEFRGPFPTFWAIMHKGKIGITAHFIDDHFDTGDILYFKEVNIDYSKTKSILGADYKIFTQVSEVIKKVINILDTNSACKFKQNNISGYYSFPTKNEVFELKKERGFKLFTLKEFIEYFI